MWNKVDNNCGIGAGGFQPGNKCAKEDGAGSPAKKEEGGGLFGAMIGKLSDKMNDTAKAKADKHRNDLNDAPPPPPVKSSPSAKGFQIARKYGLNPAIVNLAEVGHTYIQKHDWKAARQTYLKGIEEVDKESLKERLTRKVKAGLKLIKFQFGRILDWIKDKVNWIRDKVGLGVQNASGGNCGTGAGGFKPGNTCASGKELGDGTIEGALKTLGLPGKLTRYPGSTTPHAVLTGEHEVIDKAVTTLRKRLPAIGFKEVGKRTRGGSTFGYESTYEHPHGHWIHLIRSRVGNPVLRTYFTYVPRDSREGLQLSKDAAEATYRTPGLGARIDADPKLPEYAVESARESDYKDAQIQHAKLKHIHTSLANTAKDDSVRKRHEDAATLHSIARDWYMDKLGVQNAADNCGTGAGGFKKGNTCAKGSTASFSTVQALGKAITPPGGRPYKIPSAMADIKGLTQIGREATGIPEAMFPKYLDDLINRYYDLGFKPAPGQIYIGQPTDPRPKLDARLAGAGINLEHPEGHQIEIVASGPINQAWSSSRGTRAIYTATAFVPPSQRQGYQVSREAFLHSVNNPSPRNEQWPGRVPFSTQELLLRATSKDADYIKKLHERYIRYHQEAIERQPEQYRKWHQNGIALHSIARDYYMDKLGVQNANCGTGDGGFKKGNTCRWGEHEEIATDRDGLAKALGISTKASDTVSEYAASYSQTFRDGADPNGGWYALQAAQEHEQQVEKNLKALGFSVREGSISTYDHPQGHTAHIRLSMPANNRALFSVYLTYVPKPHREGVSLSRDALETSTKAAIGTYGDHTEAANAAWHHARQGRFAEAANAHRRAAVAHEAYKDSPKAERDNHLKAASLHRIAYDWYAERAGLQANSWKPIRIGQRGSHVGSGR